MCTSLAEIFVLKYEGKCDLSQKRSWYPFERLNTRQVNGLETGPQTVQNGYIEQLNS